MPRGDRNPDAVVEARVIEILPYVSFLSRSDLLQLVTKEKNWNISPKTLDNYIARAREILRENHETFKNNAAQNILNNLTELYKQAFLQQDFKLCAQLQKQISDIFGISQSKIDITSGGEQLTGFTIKLTKE